MLLPVCVTDLTAGTNYRGDDAKWFVDCTDLHRAEGRFSAKRYRITLPNSTDYYPVKINVASTVDFVVKLVGGASSADIGTEDGTLSTPRPRRYTAKMVQAPGVSHTTYTVEISTENTNTTGTFSVTMEWFDLEPPTNLEANGHSTGTTGQSEITWDIADGAKGHKVEYLVCPPPRTCSGETWPSQTATTNEVTLRNLQLNTLYRVIVRSTLGDHLSQESEAVYTYPTTEPEGCHTGLRWLLAWQVI